MLQENLFGFSQDLQPVKVDELSGVANDAICFLRNSDYRVMRGLRVIDLPDVARIAAQKHVQEGTRNNIWAHDGKLVNPTVAQDWLKQGGSIALLQHRGYRTVGYARIQSHGDDTEPLSCNTALDIQVDKDLRHRTQWPWWKDFTVAAVGIARQYHQAGNIELAIWASNITDLQLYTSAGAQLVTGVNDERVERTETLGSHRREDTILYMRFPDPTFDADIVQW